VKVLVPLLFLVACFDPSKSPSCTIQCLADTDCPDGLTCSAARTCTSGEDCTMPASCTPGNFVACVNGASRTCNATGNGIVDQDCGATGCNPDTKQCNACVPNEVSCTADNTHIQQCAADGTALVMGDLCVAGCQAPSGGIAAHCTYISPVWMPNICDDLATIDAFAPNATATYDDALDTNCTGGVITQAGGRSICVVRAKTITIGNGVALTISGPRPIAFVADDALTVSGTIDVSASTSTSGPGGGQRSSGASPNGQSTGGGGAGFGTAGVAGGGSGGAGLGAAGGAALDPLTLTYFGGGAHAFQSTLGVGGPPDGGGGGGALMLVSCRGTVTVTGTLDANGGGGRGAFDQIFGAQISITDGGAGGGTGGYVVAQGLAVTISGQLYANGGGGGGGCTANDASGTSGGDGQRNTNGGIGGSGNGGGAAGGGHGGGTAATAQVGFGGTSSGGGGGGMGVLQLYTPIGVNPTTTGATTSPAFATHRKVTLR